MVVPGILPWNILHSEIIPLEITIAPVNSQIPEFGKSKFPYGLDDIGIRISQTWSLEFLFYNDYIPISMNTNEVVTQYGSNEGFWTSINRHKQTVLVLKSELLCI